MKHSLFLFAHHLLGLLALPKVGLPAIFLVTLISASVVPVAVDPVVFGYIKLDPGMFWPGILASVAGSVLGGAILYGVGRGARKAVAQLRHHHGQEGHGHGHPAPARASAGSSFKSRLTARAQAWARKLGPSALLLCWLPGLGDAMCLVAGGLRLAFWPSMLCMAVAKFLRTFCVTVFLIWASTHWPGWHL